MQDNSTGEHAWGVRREEVHQWPQYGFHTPGLRRPLQNYNWGPSLSFPPVLWGYIKPPYPYHESGMTLVFEKLTTISTWTNAIPERMVHLQLCLQAPRAPDAPGVRSRREQTHKTQVSESS